MSTIPTLLPGDVIVVSKWTPLAGLVTLRMRTRWNHVAVVSHVDAMGRTWITEARPGGVGSRTLDALNRFAYGHYLSNAAQPKTDEQRQIIASGVASMLKTPYDWSAIEANAFAELEERTGVGWSMSWDGLLVPAHVICSSLAAYWQWKAGLPGPHSWKASPLTWAGFIDTEGWVGQPR